MSERSDGLNDEGGCAVDWSWLVGAEIVGATSSLDTLTIRFRSGETLEVKALLWKERPFLSFKPHEPPRR